MPANHMLAAPLRLQQSVASRLNSQAGLPLCLQQMPREHHLHPGPQLQKPRAGFTTVGSTSLQMKDGTGSAFDLRMRGYARHKRKAASAAHVWEPLCVDVFKRPVGSKPVFHVASKLTLPPPPYLLPHILHALCKEPLCENNSHSTCPESGRAGGWGQGWTDPGWA